MGMLPDKEWLVTMQMIIITGFQQVNEHLNQVEDLMKGKPSEVKQQLNEIVTPEQFLLRVMPGNIDGIKSYHVSYPAIIVRKGDVTVLDLILSSQNWKKIEAQK